MASSGTSLTIEQIRLIRRLTPNVTIIYDGDAHDPKAVVQPELDEEVGAL